ncbi:hypothetical protein TNCV_1022121 [Trichonephila clavipes]|nr:hypothetical protein TNCV_1022121 [Trichonephila clavipes]
MVPSLLARDKVGQHALEVHASSPLPKQFKTVASAGSAFFLMPRSKILVHFLEQRRILTPLCTPGHVTIRFPCALSYEINLKGISFNSDDDLKKNVKECVRHSYRNSGNKESFGSLMNRIVVLKPMVYD